MKSLIWYLFNWGRLFAGIMLQIGLLLLALIISLSIWESGNSILINLGVDSVIIYLIFKLSVTLWSFR